MKKVILILITAVLTYLLFNTIANGMEIGKLKIPSFSQIQNDNKELDEKLKALDSLINNDYAQKVREEKSAETDFKNKKESYETLALNATDEQLEQAMKSEKYLLDYLWIVVGNYANDNDVKFLMNVNDDEDFTIDFDITGRYISLINFIYDLANDAELRFVIDNIQLEGGSNQNVVTKGKFTVSGINVITRAEDDDVTNTEETIR